MTIARFLVGDVFARLADIPDGSVDLVLTSPPFLALRSYLPDDHPDKALEIGSEATPAGFIDTLLDLTAEWGRVLAPHGSIAVELGDTYADSGRVGDWPFEKSLCGIPQAYQLSLAYGRNVLTGAESPAGMWRVRTLKPWIRSNPPVGALGDKERPATSYVIVATRARDRYFDLDAVRTAAMNDRYQPTNGAKNAGDDRGDGKGREGAHFNERTTNPAGAPPRDWWHHVDEVINACLDDMAGKFNGGENPAGKAITEADRRRLDAVSSGGVGDGNRYSEGARTTGARGVHIRRALERAGILATVDAVDVSPKGYAGAHYAVWPPELVRLLVDEMCPRKVCRTCGQPSRRITVDRSAFARQPELAAHIKERREALGITSAEVNGWFGYKEIAKNWERTDRHGAAIPNPGDWPVLAERLGLDRERFDDLVLGERNWAESTTEYVNHHSNGPKAAMAAEHGSNQRPLRADAVRRDLGWSDCGCPGDDRWRPGLVLDPFVGSGTTLAVCTGMARDSVGIDLDERNADLARERVGMFLDVDEQRK